MFQKLISGNYFLSAFTLVFSFGMNHYLNLNQGFLVAIFLSLGIFLVYNFQQKGLDFFKLVVAKLVLLSIVLLAFMIQLNLKSSIILILNLLISVVYIYPSRFSLRKIPFLKLFLIAFCWTTSFVVFPQTLISLKLNWSLIFMMFLFFILLALPFDIQHVEEDKGIIQTIPVKIGSKKTQYLMFILLFVLLFYNYYVTIFSLNNVFFWILCIQFTVSICFVRLIQSNNLIFFMFDTLLIISGLLLFVQ